MHLLLILLLSPTPARAQNVTASFNMSALGENPAATATRQFGIVSPMVSLTTSAQTIKADQDTNVTTEWKRDIGIQRYGLMLAGHGKTFVPEFYASQNKAQIKIQIEGTGEQSKNNVSLFNSLLNLAYHVSDRIKLGLTVFKVQLEYQRDGTYDSASNGDSTSYTSNWNLADLGVGVGCTAFVTSNFAVGGFYTKIMESSDYTTTTQLNSTPVNTDTGSESYGHEKYGAGLSYQIGSPKSKGLRMELSHTKMNFGSSRMYSDPESTSSFKNSQDRIAIEATTMGLTGGLSFTRVYGRYINYTYFLDSVISEFPYYNKPLDVWGGFLGFKSQGGSSLGGFAYYYNGKSDMKFLGLDVSAQVTEYSVGVNYSYAF